MEREDLNQTNRKVINTDDFIVCRTIYIFMATISDSPFKG